jgi:hypothetical protein
MLPRFRVVAVSMKRLQIGVARIAAIPVDMIHLNPVVMLEDQVRQASLARWERRYLRPPRNSSTEPNR